MAGPRIPVSTYRLQFNREFRFDAAAALVPYLDALGITDLYASPLIAARRGSPHGYDVTDPGRLNPELGGGEDFTGLAGSLRQREMGLLLDIVPNHMAASSENPWWRDVLKYGRDSAYAACFDIDWRPGRPGLAGKVLLPILGKPYGSALEDGELSLAPAEDGFNLCYFEKRLPLSPGSSIGILRHWPEAKAAATAPEHMENPVVFAPSTLKDSAAGLPYPVLTSAHHFDGDSSRWKDLVTGIPAFGHPAAVPPAELPGALMKLLDSAKTQQSAGDLGQFWKRFWRLYSTLPAVKVFVDEKLQILNGRKGEPRSFDQLDRILAEQNYRLAFWQLAKEEINYRRFFDVSDLVSMRIEERDVFEAAHALVFRLAQTGQVTGLRVDHVDGLHDPKTYLDRLQERLAGAVRNPFYVVVEKILDPGEELPEGWPVYGTTGYDFLNTLNALFVDECGAGDLDALYARLGGSKSGFEDAVYEQKKRVMTVLFAGETRNLARQLGRLAEEDRYGHDLTLDALGQALVETTACLPVYRTYIRNFTVAARDREYIETSSAAAVRRCPAARRPCEFLRRVLLLDFPHYLSAGQRQAWLRFTMRWQQFTGPIMAKGSEDTALYIYNRLVSLNEVGGDPGAAEISVAEFHRRNRSRMEHWPHSISATSTHDTKRGEDVRARINVLSEIPAAWAERVERWRCWNSPKKQVLKGRSVPDGNEELLIYQTLVGAWPLPEEEIPPFKERLQAYLVKAAREAKVHTSWLDPDAGYEDALKTFAASILEPANGNQFFSDFTEFQKVVSFYGALNSLAQLLLKIASPGVPDFYQGTELWNFSLVDPDNRRPVDFESRNKLLSALIGEEAGGQPALARKLAASWQDGRIKLYLTYKALNFRRGHRELFASGEYIPVEVAGPARENACAFARRRGSDWALVAAPRLIARLQAAKRTAQTGTAASLNGLDPKETDGKTPLDRLLPGEKVWAGSTLILPEGAPDRWRNIFTGEELAVSVTAAPGQDAVEALSLPLAAVFGNFPVALMAGELNC